MSRAHRAACDSLCIFVRRKKLIYFGPTFWECFFRTGGNHQRVTEDPRPGARRVTCGSRFGKWIVIYSRYAYVYLTAKIQQPKKLRKKEMKKMKNEEEKKTIRMSSAYTRIVGNDKLDVINTKQTPGLVKKAYNTKWIVLKTTGNRTAIIAQTDKKYDSIDILLATEIELKKKLQEDNS